MTAKTFRLRSKATGKVYWAECRVGFRGIEYNLGGGWRPTPTGPVVFTLIKECSPTLLFDEVDNLFGRNGGGGKQQVRAVLNTGYKPGAEVPRMAKGAVEWFPVFAPAAFAGLGRLPETLMTRSVVVRMRRRRRGQVCDAYMPKMHAPLGLGIGAALGAWCASVLPELASAWPAMPEGPRQPWIMSSRCRATDGSTSPTWCRPAPHVTAARTTSC